MTVPKADQRRISRAARRALSAEQQHGAAQAVAASLEGWLDGLTPGTVAATIATDGELSPAPVVAHLRARGWRVAYPRIADGAMTFHLADEDALAPAALGLSEPTAASPRIEPDRLDLVLVPLVAFDRSCNRMGRGRAYYDLAFAFLAAGDRPARPVLVGLAHDVQLVDDLEVEAHDVVLDAVVTPTHLHGRLPRP